MSAQPNVGVRAKLKVAAPHDPTDTLRAWVRTWKDCQQLRIGTTQRHLDDDARERLKNNAPAQSEGEKAVRSLIAEHALSEEQSAKTVARLLRQHPLWPWLSQFKGLGGAYTALVIAAIGDPHRFPGQRCSVGHYHRPVYEAGAPCPNRAAEYHDESDATHGRASKNGAADARVESDVPLGCPGTMLPPRPGTGVRSVWHYLGLHVVDGRSPSKRKGQRCTWNLEARSAILMPDVGIAAQIVRYRPERFGGIYDAAKERLTRERGAECGSVTDVQVGSAELPEQAVGADESERTDGLLRPFQIDALARKIAAKAFIGDLLTAWKQTAA